MPIKVGRYGEPWKWNQATPGVLDISGLARDGTEVLVADKVGFIHDSALRRVIACVNACAGITMKQLSQGVIAAT